jgi:NADP-dependent 3-hydroxy acid dehydrogenase YdfG
MSAKPYQDQVVWITGASSGVGEGLAEAFAEAGARVVLSARREAELLRVREKLGTADVLVLPMDVTDYGSLPDKVATVHQHFGHIDMLVCNAGIGQRSRVEDTSMETFRRLLEVDFFAVVEHVQAVFPIMREQRSGHIVVTSSVAGKFGIPAHSAYCAAKHALHGFCDTLRAEVAEYNIAVSTLIIAAIKSNVYEHALTGDGSELGNAGKAMEGGMDALSAGRTMVKRLARKDAEINVVAHWRASVALWQQRLRPSAVYRRMAKIAQTPAWR